jgi:hypothetical protein
MNPAQIHLLLNHFPVFASATASVLMAYALVRGNTAYQRAACALLIAAAITAPAVFLSGHGAEDKVEYLIGVARSRIHAHEEAGEGAAIGIVLLGLLAAAQLIGWSFPNAARWRTKGAYVILLGSVLVCGWTGWASHLGGLIRHGAELDAPAPLSAPQGEGKAAGE